MNIIGLSGPAGSGKDTVAGMIIERRVGWCTLSFAEPMKRMLVAGGFLTQEQIEDRWFKETPLSFHGCSPRHLMQTLGTEWGRKLIAPDIWVRLLNEQVSTLAENGVSGVVITDVRFENEATYIRSHGGRVVHVRRDTARKDRHESERGIKIAYGDMAIYNNGPIDALRGNVEVLLAALT